jgi:hypothetical protein
MKAKDNNNNKIRILFLSANPKGTKQLDLDKEYNVKEDAIESAGSVEQFLLKPKPKTSISRLQEFSIKYKPQIVHFAEQIDDALETRILRGTESVISESQFVRLGGPD